MSVGEESLFNAFDRMWKTSPLVLLLFLSAACSGAPEGGLVDGLGSTQGHLSPATGPVTPLCEAPAAGCPCAADGTSIECQGPKIQTGNYTTCTPGARFCTGGTWGACIGKTLYQNVDMVTQDFESPCAAGTQVSWSELTLQGLAPSGSRVDVAVQTADGVASLGAAPMTPVGSFDSTVTTPWSGVDVGAALSASGQSSASWLRVTITLVRSSSNATSPSVTPPQLASQCVATH